MVVGDLFQVPAFVRVLITSGAHTPCAVADVYDTLRIHLVAADRFCAFERVVVVLEGEGDPVLFKQGDPVIPDKGTVGVC